MLNTHAESNNTRLGLTYPGSLALLMALHGRTGQFLPG